MLERVRGRRLAFEIKLAWAPSPSRSFWWGLGDLKLGAAFVIYSGKERYSLGQRIDALPVSMLPGVLRT